MRSSVAANSQISQAIPSSCRYVCTFAVVSLGATLQRMVSAVHSTKRAGAACTGLKTRIRRSISAASIPAPSAISPKIREMLPRPGMLIAFSAGKESTKSHRNAKANRPAAVRFPLRIGFRLRRREGESTVSGGQPKKQNGQSRQLYGGRYSRCHRRTCQPVGRNQQRARDQSGRRHHYEQRRSEERRVGKERRSRW